MTRHLIVCFLDKKVGLLKQLANGRLEFVYDPQWLASRHALAISVSLPLSSKTYTDEEARPFFSGLLPDAEVRSKLAKILQVSEKNDYGLLEELGRECAGAISFYPPEEISQNHPPRIIDQKQLGELINALSTRPLLAGISDVRLSLAGAQNKMAVQIIDGQFALPRDGFQATTHIIKPAVRDLENSIYNEFFCMRLAQRILGKERVPTVEWRIADGVPFLLITRYDRKINGQEIIRIHQEDFCQALGVPPDKKYQRADHGPSLQQCFQLVDANSIQPAKDRLHLLDAIIFNYIIGNADAHAKNFSFLYQDKGLALAPFYDLLCTLVYPKLTAKLAMKIGDYYEFDRIYLKQWEAMARELNFTPTYMRNRLEHFSRILPAKAHEFKEEQLAQKAHLTIYDKIIRIIESHTSQINIALRQAD